MSVKWIGFSKQQAVIWQMRTLLGDRLYTSVQWYNEEEDLLKVLGGGIDASVLLIAHEKDDMVSLCERVTLSHPHISIVIVDHSGKVDLRTAMRAGAMDVIAF